MSYDVERGVPTIHIGSAGAPSYPDTCGTTVTYPSKPHQDHSELSFKILKKLLNLRQWKWDSCQMYKVLLLPLRVGQLSLFFTGGCHYYYVYCSY